MCDLALARSSSLNPTQIAQASERTAIKTTEYTMYFAKYFEFTVVFLIGFLCI